MTLMTARMRAYALALAASSFSPVIPYVAGDQTQRLAHAEMYSATEILAQPLFCCF